MFDNGNYEKFLQINDESKGLSDNAFCFNE